MWRGCQKGSVNRAMLPSGRVARKVPHECFSAVPLLTFQILLPPTLVYVMLAWKRLWYERDRDRSDKGPARRV